MDIRWIITGPVTGDSHADSVRIRNSDGRTCDLSVTDDGELLFDGQFIDAGDDYMDYLTVMEEVAETGHSEPYRK